MGQATDQPGGARPSARSAGAAGNLVEWFDFAVFGASATLVAQALTPGGQGAVAMVFAVFAVAFVVRPVGALLGAVWADRAGRRLPLLATVLAITLATAGIGLLPPWSAAGGLVVVALCLFRVAQGLATGAELVVSVTYLLEHAPAGRRGLWGGVHMATMALGFAGGTAVVWAVAAALPRASLEAWGWRVPFLLALPLGVAALQLRRRCCETPAYEDLVTGSGPAAGRAGWAALRSVRPTLVRGFVLTAALMSSFSLWFVYLPAHLADSEVASLSLALGGALAGLLTMVAAAMVCGHLSDRFGRSPVILSGLAVLGVAWTTAYPFASAGSEAALLPAQVAAGAGLGALVVQSTLAEALPVAVRARGLAVTIGLAAALVGGTSPLLAQLLAQVDASAVPLYAVAWLVLAAVGTTRPARAATGQVQGAWARR